MVDVNWANTLFSPASFVRGSAIYIKFSYLQDVAAGADEAEDATTEEEARTACPLAGGAASARNADRLTMTAATSQRKLIIM